MVKVILFDWDGTCHNSIDNLKTAYFKTIEELNIPGVWDDYRLKIGMPTVEQSVLLYPQDPDKFTKIFRGYYLNLPMCEFYPNTKETLYKLKENFTLCLVTSKTRSAAIDCMNGMGISDVFDHMICGDDVSKGKPDPEPILKALEYYNISSNEALYIGDSAHDIKASKAANVSVIGVTWGALYREEIEAEKPTYIADTWDEVINICNKLK